MTYGPAYVEVVSDGQGGYREIPILGPSPTLSGLRYLSVVNPYSGSLLRWRPPAQKTPTIVNVPQGFYSGSFGPTEDVIFNWPASVRFSEFITTGGRHLRMIAGASTKGAGGSGIQVTGCSGSVFMEGLAIDMTSCPGDGINACGSTSGPYTLLPDVYIQNCRLLNINGSNAGADADVYQPQGGIGNLFMDRVTFTSNYQGISLFRGQAPIGNVYISRTNGSYYTLAGSDPTYVVWLIDSTKHGPWGASFFDQFYIAPRAGENLSQAVEPITGTVDADGNPIGQVTSDNYATITFPNAANVSGSIISGPPPGGDFCAAGVPGFGYVSPGYA